MFTVFLSIWVELVPKGLILSPFELINASALHKTVWCIGLMPWQLFSTTPNFMWHYWSQCCVAFPQSAPSTQRSAVLNSGFQPRPFAMRFLQTPSIFTILCTDDVRWSRLCRFTNLHQLKCYILKWTTFRAILVSDILPALSAICKLRLHS